MSFEYKCSCGNHGKVACVQHPTKNFTCMKCHKVLENNEKHNDDVKDN